MKEKKKENNWMTSIEIENRQDKWFYTYICTCKKKSEKYLIFIDIFYDKKIG